MILIIDNYDSFVHNLARYFTQHGRETRIVRNDAVSVADIKAIAPRALVLSPGPCAPRQAGICIEAIKALGAGIPILGVCLGHQAIGEAYGLQTIRGAPTHGKTSTITHNGKGLFSGLPSPLEGGRYHSLICDPPHGTSDLEVTATCENGTIMALTHKSHPVFGIQFHPESVLTPQGMDIIANFCTITDQWHANRSAA